MKSERSGVLAQVSVLRFATALGMGTLAVTISAAGCSGGSSTSTNNGWPSAGSSNASGTSGGSNKPSGNSGSSQASGSGSTAGGGSSNGGGSGSTGGGSGSPGGTGSGSTAGSGSSHSGSSTSGSGTSTGGSGSSTSSGSTSSGSSSGSSSGNSSGSSSSGSIMTTGSGAKIPAANGSCPTLTGLSGSTVTINSQTVVVWSGTMGSKPAPLLFYWHGTGSTPQEAQAFFGTQLPQITSAGGLVASFSSTTGTGSNSSGDGVFYSDDFNTADQILACAVQQLNIDTSRIFSAGCSAGGLQTGSMVYARSSYLACGMPNSGGAVIAGALQDSHVPSAITVHGAPGSDVVVIDFSQTSATFDNDIKSKGPSSMPPGGYVVDCNTGGGHCGAQAADIAAQWQFCMDHPFGVSSDPYSGTLPSSFPSHCTIIR